MIDWLSSRERWRNWGLVVFTNWGWLSHLPTFTQLRSSRFDPTSETWIPLFFLYPAHLSVGKWRISAKMMKDNGKSCSIRRGQVSEIAVLAWNGKPALGRESLIRWAQLPLSGVSGWCSHCQRKPRVSLSSQGAVGSPPTLLPIASTPFPKVVYWSLFPQGHFLSRTQRQQWDAYVVVFFLGQALEGVGSPSELASLDSLGLQGPGCLELLSQAVPASALLDPLWDQNWKWPPCCLPASFSSPPLPFGGITLHPGALERRRGWRPRIMAPRARDLRILCQLQPTSCAAYGQLLNVSEPWFSHVEN